MMKKKISALSKNKFASFFLLLMFLFSTVTSAADKNIFAANRNAGKYIALTFDDGPHPAYTEKILDILKENNAKATFFVIGKNAEKYPELILREYTEGHEIGNHTYSHPDMNKIDVTQAIDEISKTQDIIFNITGEYPVSFRAPGGRFSQQLIDVTNSFNCKPVLWSWRQDTFDWTLPRVDTIVNKVLKNLQDGDVILFHDFNQKGSPTPQALKILLPKLNEKGYSLVTVSELYKIKQSK